jgi:hypothetical protein
MESEQRIGRLRRIHFRSLPGTEHRNIHAAKTVDVP